MANIHKVQLYIVDANNSGWDVDEIISLIKNRTGLMCQEV